MGASPSDHPDRLGSDARDHQAGQPTGVEGADAHVLETGEPDRPVFRVVRGKHGEFRAHREAAEVFRLGADIHEAHRYEAARDDLCTPEDGLEARLEEGRLALDVQDVPTELTDIRVVRRIHVDASDPKIVTLHFREGIREHRRADRRHHGDVRVRLAGERVEARDSNAV